MRNSRLERARKMIWVFPAAELNQWTPNPSRLNFLRFSRTKVIHNIKLNFCSVWVSQEAFLPHVNGMAARHFWKEKTTMLVKRLSGIKSVQVINETGCRQKRNKNNATYSEGEPINTVSISEHHAQGMVEEKIIIWVIDPTYHRHLNANPYCNQLC